VADTVRALPRAARVAVARWFDVGADPGAEPEAEPPRVDWLRAVPFVLVHVACAGVVWVG